MNTRACLLAALLVSPAWAEEPAPASPAPAARSFDLRDAAVKKIVHDTAATQYGSVQLGVVHPGEVSPAVPVKATPAAMAFVPAERPSAVVHRAPALQPQTPAAPTQDGFLTSLIDMLIDGDDGVTYAELHDEWLRCQSRGDDLKTTRERAASCPGKSTEHRSVSGNPQDFKTVPSP
jgi:hypothetical protein